MIQIEDTIIRKLIYHRLNLDNNSSVLSETLYDFTNDEEEAVLKTNLLTSSILNESFSYRGQENKATPYESELRVFFTHS